MHLETNIGEHVDETIVKYYFLLGGLVHGGYQFACTNLTRTQHALFLLFFSKPSSLILVINKSTNYIPPDNHV
jgi:hypothetical protein